MRHKNLNWQNLKVAAFDWDNTLALTKETLIAAVDELLKNHDMPEWEKIKCRRNPNLSFKDNFPNIFGNKAQELYEEYREIYLNKIAASINTPNKANEVLSMFHDHGIKNIIISNKERSLLEYELPMIYPPELFDKIVCGHEAPADKPNPEQLRYGVYDFIDNITNQNTWMIGDSPMDSLCAKSAGALSIRIGNDLWNDISEDNRDIIFINSFAEMYNSLTEQNNDK